MDDVRATMPVPIGDVRGDVRWMTYDELGQARGITTASATRLAFRRKWQRHPGNDGAARVAVPVHEIRIRQGDGIPDTTLTIHVPQNNEAPHHQGDEIELVRETIALVRGQIERERARADKAEARAETAEAEAVKERQGREAERIRADQAETALKMTEARATRAETAAAKWEAWLASGLGARLLAIFWKA